jgi:hypothetical protein
MASAHLEIVFNGASDGSYTLPKDLVQLDATFRTANSARIVAAKDANDPTKDPRWVENNLVREALDRIARGKSLDGIEEAAVKARRQRERSDARHRILTEATRTAESDLAQYINHHADTVISEHLKPALAKTLDEAAAARDALGPVAPVAAAVIEQGTAEQHAAYNKLAAAARRYEAIHACRKALMRMRTPKTSDTADVYGELEGIAEFYPAGIFTNRPTPWPSDPAAKLAWIVEHRDQAKPWVPTKQEQDAALMQRQADAVENVSKPKAMSA